MANIKDFLDVDMDASGKVTAKKDLVIKLNKENFNTGFAKEVDSTIATYGIFEISDLEDKSSFDCFFPLVMKLNVFTRDDEDSKYVKLLYRKDEIVADTVVSVGSAKDISLFLGYLMRGAVDIEKPEDLVEAFKGNMLGNGISSNVPSALLEIMIGDMYRYSKDTTIPLRIALANPKVQPTDFEIVNIKELSRLSSVFNAISFEDMKKALQASVAITRSGKLQTPSPIESVLRT